MPSIIAIDAGTQGFARGLGERLDEVIARAAAGDLLQLDSSHPMLDAALGRWCTNQGHAIKEKTVLPGGGFRYLVMLRTRGITDDVLEEPSHRLWLYTNFHCNLSCDYCCVRSTPRASPRELDLATIARLAHEAPSLGFRRILLTGGEPFLRPDLDRVVEACADRLPTTVLTNAMLLTGARRQMLERMPRDRVTLQVSLDSPDPLLHDLHRGPGSWARARDGIALARSLGFRVRIAATTHDAAQAAAMHAFLDGETIPIEDRLVRPVALRGEAKEGVPLRRHELRPEITITAAGAYWHPVGATDDDLRITADVGSLAKVCEAARGLEATDRARTDQLAATFHCT